jgi:predicted metal-dependent peptidase
MSPIKIDKARDWSLRTPCAVFYGVLASNLRDVMDATIQTACTDGKVIRWNPEFVAGLTDEEVRFVLLHEAMHCGLGHFWRLPITTDGNKAGDYAINAILSRIPGTQMPTGGLLDARFSAMAEEEILAAISKKPEPDKDEDDAEDGDEGEPQQAEEGQGEADGADGQPEAADGPGEAKDGPGEAKDEGGCGGFSAPAPDAPDEEGMQDRWEAAVLQADYVSKSLGQGNAPAEMQRMIDAVKISSVSWKNEMAEFVRSQIASRSDWSRSSRRMAGAPVIYPRRKKDRPGLVVFVRDTSGSIDGKILSEFNAHIETAMSETGCSALVIDADAVVCGEYRLEAGDTVPQTAQGGGGTDFRPAFARAAALAEGGETIAGLVYLTDLEGEEPESADFPVLWLCTRDATARTGRTVKIK